MKGKTLKQITNTPKAGLKELPSLPNNEDFNIEVTSKESCKKYTVSTNILGSGGLESVIAGDNITIDDTDPQNPIISATGTGGGGSYIPLSGTEVGSPVTGDVEFDQSQNIGLFSGANLYFRFYPEDVYNEIGGYTVIMGRSGSSVALGSSNGISGLPTGIAGNADYSANITDLDYPQKIYVDTHIAFTTVPSSSSDTGTKGQMAIDSTYLYVCVDTNTWVRTLLVTW